MLLLLTTFLCMVTAVVYETGVDTQTATVTQTLNVTLDLAGTTGQLIQIELFGNVNPATIANFETLCLNTAGTEATYQTGTFQDKTYHGNSVFKVIQGFYAVTGDIVNNDGTGNEANSGMVMRDENFELKHDDKYLISMVRPNGPHTTGSQFMITFRAMPQFDGLQQVIGRVSASTTAIIDDLEALGSNDLMGMPSGAILITDCVVA